MTSPVRTTMLPQASNPSSQLSAHPIPARPPLSVSTRSMARGTKTALGEIYRNGAATERIGRTMTGGKRKEMQREEGIVERRRKMVRYSNENMGEVKETKSSTAPSPVTPPRMTPPSITNNVTTPIRSMDITLNPTPAREILKAGFQKDMTDEEEERSGDPSLNSRFVLKPPTPPRLKPRPGLYNHGIIPEDVPMTPGKRPRSPSPSLSCSSKKAVLADVQSGPSDASSTPPEGQRTQTALVAYSNTSSIESPRRALGAISRFGTTPKKGSALFPPLSGPTASARMTPTVPIPFTFSTPRSKPATDSTTTSESTEEPHDTGRTASTASEVDASIAADIEKATRIIKSLPKTFTMGPPSRLPVKASKATTVGPSAVPASAMPTASSSSKAKPRPQLGVAERRPTRRVTSGSSSAKPLAVLDESGDAKPAEAPVRRKPSYPSSLGSGPLAKPRSRLVSGPIQPPRSFSSSTTGPQQSDMDVDHKVHATARSVSDPVGRPRASLSLSTRREGFMSDTSQSLAGLSDALAKLKMKKDSSSSMAGPSIAPRPRAPAVLADVSVAGVNANLNTSHPSSSRLSSVHRPRASIAGADMSVMEDGDRSLAVLMNNNSGAGNALRGVVAFVDAKTEDGGCAGDIWSDMLRGLGAKVNVRLTTAVTHIIYKSGLPTTLNWYRRQEQEERPYLVGVGWLLKSKKAGERLDEAEFTVDIAVEDIFQKRRKSMEPKALAAASQGIPPDISGVSGLSLATRKSLQYAPKIGSPLKKGYTRFDDY